MKLSPYFKSEYLTYRRWQSFWHQLDLTRQCSPKNILEIGSGSGLITHILKKSGYRVTTLDNDPQLEPDIVADLNSFSFKKNQFDLVICCQVLEHLPFKNFLPLLKKLKKTTKKYLIISLPEDSLTTFQLAFKIIN
jgi:2-polyprenyl-3-methyl-5-hydroxy-6-metoxy-1,4-benzoquinol methylase